MRRLHIILYLVVGTVLMAVAGIGTADEATPSERAALEAYRQGAFSRAADLYEKALSETTDPTHRAQLHVRIAWTLFALGRKDGVETHLRAALVDDPELTLVPDYYTREFLDLFERAKREPPPRATPSAQQPQPDLEAELASIDQRVADGHDLEGALADTDRLLDAYPGDSRLLPLKLQLLEKLGRNEEAAALLSKLQSGGLAGGRSAPKYETLSLPDLILRANQFLDQGDVDTALQLLREAVSRQPSNVAALELLAEAAQRAARWQEAEFALKSALALQPDNLELKLRLGDVLLAMGDTSAALDTFQELTQRFPNSDRAWAAVGLLDARVGRADRALGELARALEENPLLPEVQLAYGELLLLRGEDQKALAALRSASNLLQDDPQVEARLGQALLAQGSGERALQHLESAVQGGFHPADVQRSRVLALLATDRLEDARRALDAADLAGEPDLPILRSLVALRSGDPAAAETLLRSSLAEHPDDPVLLNLAAVAAYRQGRYADAVTMLERAVAARSESPELQGNLGLARSAAAANQLLNSALVVQAAPRALR